MKKEYASPKMKCVTINVKDDIAIGENPGKDTSIDLAKPAQGDASEDASAPQTTWDDEE